MRPNSVAPDVFAKVVNVTNHTGLKDAELTWYSPSATFQIYLYDLEHGLVIHVQEPTWPCLIDEFLTVWVKFLESSGYSTEINFCSTYEISWIVWLLYWDQLLLNIWNFLNRLVTLLRSTFAPHMKFLESSGYSTEINFCSTYEISWIIWLLYWDQLLLNICFWRHNDPVPTCKA